MLGTGFDIFIGLASLVCGILLLTGNGDILLKSSNSAEQRKIYDVKKMEKPTGIILVLIGILTLVDTWLNIQVLHALYFFIVLVLFVILFIYYRKKCMRK